TLNDSGIVPQAVKAIKKMEKAFFCQISKGILSLFVIRGALTLNAGIGIKLFPCKRKGENIKIEEKFDYFPVHLKSFQL
ncbi:MAG: hypothetical protein WDZ80_02250, partial [Candidatus Paceibacterota bacterium]